MNLTHHTHTQPTSALGTRSPRPHPHLHGLTPAHICTRLSFTPANICTGSPRPSSAPGLGSPQPTSAPGLGSPQPTSASICNESYPSHTHPAHICTWTWTGLTLAHICTWTCAPLLTPATSGAWGVLWVLTQGYSEYSQGVLCAPRLTPAASGTATPPAVRATCCAASSRRAVATWSAALQHGVATGCVALQ